jgi:hypothetical protein
MELLTEVQPDGGDPYGFDSRDDLRGTRDPGHGLPDFSPEAVLFAPRARVLASPQRRGHVHPLPERRLRRKHAVVHSRCVTGGDDTWPGMSEIPAIAPAGAWHRWPEQSLLENQPRSLCCRFGRRALDLCADLPESPLQRAWCCQNAVATDVEPLLRRRIAAPHGMIRRKASSDTSTETTSRSASDRRRESEIEQNWMCEAINAPVPALRSRLAPTKRRGQHEPHLSPVPPLQSPRVPGEPFGSP